MKAAVILAAGDGTKIVPYQMTRQKAALPACNAPLVRRLADDLIALGIERLVVVVGHLGQQVRHALGGVPGVVFVEQGERRGTAQAALQALDVLGEEKEFLLAYGDIACARENLAALLEGFNKSGAEAAALVQPLERERGLEWLCAQVSGQRLERVAGHPRHASHRLCGVYALRASAREWLERNPGIVRHVSVGGMPPVESEAAESVQLMIEDGREILAVETTEYFVDVDKPWHILEANRRAADHMFASLKESRIHPTARVSGKAKLGGPVVLGENSVIGDGVEIEGPVWIGRDSSITRGAIIGGRVVVGDHCGLLDYCQVGDRSVIGDHCRIGHCAEFSGVAFDRVFLYHYCEICGVVGSAADIGAATVCGTLRFDDGDQAVRIKDRLERPEHGASCSFIGDYCRTGVNSVLLPGCRVGPYSCVGPGVVVYDEVPPNRMVLVKQELSEKPWGPDKYGW